MKFSLGVCRPFGPFVYFQSSTTRTYEGSGGFRFKVNFRNVFVSPRRKSLPTARFCNPRTLICWQDGLKSVDPPVPPRDPLYFLRLSGKNPRNDAGRIHHRSNFRLHSASPLPSFPRGGPSRIAFPKYIYLATCSTKGKKKIIDHRRSRARFVSLFLHLSCPPRETFSRVPRDPWNISLPCYLLEASQRGNPRDIPFRSIPVEGVKSAVSFARVVLRGAASIGGRVGGRDPGAEVARKQERAGRAGGYCLLGDLSSNTSRQATRPGHQAWGQTRAFYPYPWGQPPAPVEIKNSLYYTSHSVPPLPSPPPGQTVYTILSFPRPAPLSFRRALHSRHILPPLQRLVHRGPT